MSYGEDSVCYTSIGLCADYDLECLSAAACTAALDPTTCSTNISNAVCS